MTRVHAIDRHVGQRVRVARLAKGMSQTGLADAVGLTFQQIQKYEKGTNRVSASKLFLFAGVLGVDVGYFFAGVEEGTDAHGKVAEPSLRNDLTRVDVAILQNLGEIENSAVKRRILDLIGYLAARKGRGAEAEAH